jgi:hypothetical protein
MYWITGRGPGGVVQVPRTLSLSPAHRRSRPAAAAGRRRKLDGIDGGTRHDRRRHGRPRGGPQRLGSAASLKLLLDTHIWFWSLTDLEKLSRRVKAALAFEQ